MIQVIIPTYNREVCIQNFITQSIVPYVGKLFNFLILDSSTNDITNKICVKCNSKKLKYRRIDSKVQPDDKVIKAIMNCTDEYYWLLGDGNLVNFNEIERLFLLYDFNKFDILEVDSDKSKRRGTNESDNFIIRDDLINYIASNFTYLTYWGSSIIKTKRAKDFFLNGTMNKYRQDSLSWWSSCIICEMISLDFQNNTLTPIVSLYTKYIKGNPGKTDRSWAKGEKYYYTTFEVFNRDVALLPSMFSNVKNEIIKNFRDDELVSKRYLIKLKIRGVLTPKYIIKYKKEINIIKGYYGLMLFIAYVPDFLLISLVNIYKLLKKVIK